jgi:HSP20 family protein
MNISDLVPWKSRSPARRRDGDSITDVRREMDRLFDEFFRDFEMTPFQRDSGLSFSPSLNVAETDEHIEAEIELPGLSEEDIDVTLTGDGLTITGEKKEEGDEQGRNFFRRERRYGYFRRTIPLPPNVVDQENVEATFDKGVLKITMPKREEAQEAAKRIPVKSG